MDAQQEVAAVLAAAFGEASLDGCLHALDIDGPAEVRYRSDEVWHSASTGKVPILVTLMRAVAAGEVSLQERMRIPADGRTPGFTGLSVMRYEAELALRDVAQLMIAVSDNHATDVVLGRVSPSRVTAVMRELGLTVTTLEETTGETYQRLTSSDPGTDPDLEPGAAPWRSTAAEMCRLLRKIWRDEAAPTMLCEEMRTILRSSVLPEGLDSCFPLAVQVRTGGKSGTAFFIDTDGESGTSLVVRNEVGVIEYPDGGRYAVAVFTRTDSSEAKLHDLAAGRAIGMAALAAVDYLRAVGIADALE
jgi:beta-lactamase class A